jgi:hypothetical protein
MISRRAQRHAAASLRAELAARGRGASDPRVPAPFLAGSANQRPKLSHWRRLVRSASFGEDEEPANSSDSSDSSDSSGGLSTAGGVYFLRKPAAARVFVDELIAEGVVSPDMLHCERFSGFMARVRRDCVAWSKDRDDDGSMIDSATGHVDLDRGDNDPILPVMEVLATQTWLLHLTEWNVASVVGAMMVRRVLQSYFGLGGFVVLDGNVPLLQYDAGSAVFQNKYRNTQNMLKERIVNI